MNKQQLTTDLLTVIPADKDWTNKSLMALTKAALERLWAEVYDVAEADDTEVDELAPVKGSTVAQKYRIRYAENAAKRGHKAQTVTGKASLNNGDELALLLEDATVTATCFIADQVLNLAHGTTLAKYTTDRIGVVVVNKKTGESKVLKPLNDGMVRMNAGNRIRSWAKKHDDPQAAISEIRQFLGMVADAAADAAADEIAEAIKEELAA